MPSSSSLRHPKPSLSEAAQKLRRSPTVNIESRTWSSIPWQVKVPWILVLVAGLTATSFTLIPICLAEGPNLFEGESRLVDIAALLFSAFTLVAVYYWWWIFLWQKKRLFRTWLVLSVGVFIFYRAILDVLNHTVSNYVIYQIIIFSLFLGFFTPQANRWFSLSWNYKERAPKLLLVGLSILLFLAVLFLAIPWIPNKSKKIAAGFSEEFMQVLYNSILVANLCLFWILGILRGAKSALVFIHVIGWISLVYFVFACAMVGFGIYLGKPRLGFNIITLITFSFSIPGLFGLWIITRRRVREWLREKAPLNFIEKPNHFSWL